MIKCNQEETKYHVWARRERHKNMQFSGDSGTTRVGVCSREVRRNAPDLVVG